MKLKITTKTLLCTVLALSACNSKEKHANEIEKTRTAVIDSMNEANRQQKIIDSLTVLSSENPDTKVIQSPTFQPESQTHLPNHKKQRSTPSATSMAGTPAPGNTVNPSAGNNGTVTAKDTATANAEKKKKGLNNAAKGAIIGLGTGAAAGAVLNKENRAKGAVIGGVIGAVGGAVGGAVIDQNKKKKEAEKDSTNKK